MRRNLGVVMGVMLSVCIASLATADVVVLKNGDKLTGTIGQITDGTLNFTSPILGALAIKLTDIQSYQTDTPAKIQLNNGQSFSSQIVTATPTQITTADKQTTQFTAIKSVNPPAEVWTGSVVLNGALQRGNTNSATVGLSANATLRRDDPFYNDRFILGADYNYGKTGRGSSAVTTTDNYDGKAEYDRFFTEKFFGYGNVGYLRDRIAGLDVQLTPGAGAGYQWIETPKLNFDTEAGVAYVYEDFDVSGVDQQADLRLDYHVDAKLNPVVSVFNDAEYLCAYDDPADYLIAADAGIRADLTKNFFSQFSVVYHRNDRPAPGFQKDDLSFLLGIGWAF
jgi:putative salt-induced outer membrane protein YdiY